MENVPDPFNVGSAYVAFVGDNSSVGVKLPMLGYRYRFQEGKRCDHYNIFFQAEDGIRDKAT